MSVAPTDDTLERIRILIEHADEAPTLATLAQAAGLSLSHLQRAFRRRYGMSPAEYHRARRFSHLKSALRSGAGVTDAVYGAGFGSASRLYEHSDRLLGMTPASYRAGGAGADIRYTTTGTPLARSSHSPSAAAAETLALARAAPSAGPDVGSTTPALVLGPPHVPGRRLDALATNGREKSGLGRLLVAATARGICAVMLGDDDPTLERRLADEFPKATRQRVDAGREEWLDAVIARIAHELGWSDARAPALPPIDVAATAFQWRVWQALTRIPPGVTRSYGELAGELGMPGAARAVGNACGSNRLALIVPCHRVVREDGSLGGWRWGIERKRQLLAGERAAAASGAMATPASASAKGTAMRRPAGDAQKGASGKR